MDGWGQLWRQVHCFGSSIPTQVRTSFAHAKTLATLGVFEVRRFDFVGALNSISLWTYLVSREAACICNPCADPKPLVSAMIH
jgi:hypothetical protein